MRKHLLGALLTVSLLSSLVPGVAPGTEAPALGTRTVTMITNGWVDVRGILTTLARNTDLGLEIAPDVQGQVNVHLQDTPLDQALVSMLDPVGLGWEINDGILVVYKNRLVTRWFNFDYPVTHREGRGELTVAGRATGQGDSGGGGGGGGGGSSDANESNLVTTSTMQVWPQVIEAARTLVFQDPGMVSADHGAGSDAVSLTDGQGRILVVNPMAGLVQITAEWPRVRSVQLLLEKMESSLRRQVAISVKIFEVTTRDVDQTGVDWSVVTRGAVGASLRTAEPLTRPVFNFTVGGDDGDLMLEALSEQGTVRVLSTPRITTLNNQKAIVRVVTEEVFFAAQVEPRVVLAGGGASDPVVEYLPQVIPVGLVLDVTPQVGHDQVITLNVHPTLSHILRVETSPNEDTQPVIAVRELDTVGKVRHGETLVIAGLLSEGLQEEEAGVPVLMDVPLLGSLFKSRKEQKTKTELVIMLTPMILDAALQAELALDGEKLIHSNMTEKPGIDGPPTPRPSNGRN